MTQYQGFGKRSQATPQTQPIPGREAEMELNHENAFAFVADDMTRLTRFLITGSAGGTFYTGSYELTKENLEVVERLMKASRGHEVIDAVLAVSQAGRAASNDQALFVLARCMACDAHGKVEQTVPATRLYTLHNVASRHPELKRFLEMPQGGLHTSKDGRVAIVKIGPDTLSWAETTKSGKEEIRLVDHPDDVAVRRHAARVLWQVARTGTHWLHYQPLFEQFRGRGRIARRATRDWYEKKSPERLGYQLLKYQQRDGWGNRDVLRLARPHPGDETHSQLYRWATKGWTATPTEEPENAGLAQVWAYERIKATEDKAEAIALIRKFRLPREAVGHTEFLRDTDVWEALLPHMGLEAITRNLAVMTRNEVLRPHGDFTQFVCQRLTDPEQLKAARLHPLKLLAAYLTYQAGQSVQHDDAGREMKKTTWEPVPEVVAALNAAFYLSFDAVEPTGRRILLAVDVSSSMDGTMVAMLKKNSTPGRVGAFSREYEQKPTIKGLTASMAAAVLAMVLARSEWALTAAGIRVPNWAVVLFDTKVYKPNISPLLKLEEVVAEIGKYGHGGTNCALPFHYALEKNLDVDAILTISDNESWAGIHPCQALEMYRQKVRHPVAAINVQMAPNGVTNTDPNDFMSLEISGFDVATPELVNSFLREMLPRLPESAASETERETRRGSAATHGDE